MTRLAILADIHGNLPALEAVERDFAALGVERAIVAGDVINWGPFSRETLERVAAAGWTVIRGNHELYLLDYGTPRAPAEWHDHARFPLPPWLHRQLCVEQRELIAGWPETLTLTFPDAPPLRVAHGSPRGPWEGVTPLTTPTTVAAMLSGVAEETLILAHTHRAMDRRVGRWRILNPGSVGLPLDGRFTASYLLLDGDAGGWRATFRRVPFDYAPLFAAFARQRFIEECGVIGHLVVEEFKTARLRIAPFLRWHAAHCPTAPFTMDLLEPFSQVNIWDYTPLGFHLNRDGH